MAETKSVAENDPKVVPILSRLRPPEGSVRNHKRKGRGVGSGLGKTAGRGQKGQTARQPGAFHKLHFEGGQMPLNRRLPKVGFENIFRKTFAVVNVADLGVFDVGATVDEAALRARGVVRGRWDGVKVLGQGDLAKKLVVKAEKFSASAKEKIEKAGGTCTVVEHPVAPVVRHKNKKKAS